MNNKLLEKLNNDLKELDNKYNRLYELSQYEEKRYTPDKEFIEILFRYRLEIISKELYIKELIEVINND